MKYLLQHGLIRLMRIALPVSVSVLLTVPAIAQNKVADVLSANSAVNLLSNGGFEVQNPGFWTATGAGAEWSTEQARTPIYSLKLSGSGAASWAQNEAVVSWLGGVPGWLNPEIVVGGWVYTDGVNTAPATDADKFQLVFEFFDAPGGTDLLGGPVVLDLPQDAASSGWVELSSLSLGAIALPSEKAAKSVRITFRKGASATGAAYLEDIFIRKADDAVEGWAGDWFNASMDAGDNWHFWWNGMASGGDFPTAQPHFQYVSNADARTGNYSLRIETNGTNQDETPAISERVPVTEGEPVLFSFWVKHEGNTNPTTIGTGQNNIGMTALWYDNLDGGAAGWGEIGGVDVTLTGELNGAPAEMLVPLHVQEASSGWKHYAFVAYPKEGAVGVEMRLRYYHAFDGITYWDDVFIGPAADVVDQLAATNELSNSGFEVQRPGFWEATGAGAEWSTDQARTPIYSLKLTGSGAASWAQDEAVVSWLGGVPGWLNPEIVVGGWVYTDGVNTAPATDADKFQLVFEFFDTPGGTDLLGGPVVLDLPQDAASSGWVELSSLSLGAIALPSEKAAKSVRITFRKGASATGAAYLEDIFIRKADDAVEGWAGDWFNASMDAGDDWHFWWNGMASGGDFPTAQPHFQYVSNADARTGDYSLRIETNGTNQDETPAISERVPVTEGKPVLFSFWVKHEGNTNPTTIGTGQNNLGMTALWYDNLDGGAAGWGEIGGVDITLTGELNGAPAEMLVPLHVQEASSGWKHYAFVAYPKEGAVGVEMRLRYYHAFDGITYWDDISIIPLGGNALVGTGIEDENPAFELPESVELYQNYPNPFNPYTSITFDMVNQGRVTLSVYDVLGRRVASLVEGVHMPAGRHTSTFDASRLASGVYLYVLNVNGHVLARRMVLLK